MSIVPRRKRARAARRIAYLIRRMLWRTVRVLLLSAAALGPGTPPPPPPPPPPIEDRDDDGQALDES
jgi:hypothetical protein